MKQLSEGEHSYWVFPIKETLSADIRSITLWLNGKSNSNSNFDMAKQGFVTHLISVIDAGFEFYYETPSETNDSLSPLARRTVDSIIRTVRGAIHKVVQRLFKKMPKPDLTLMANYLDSMILTSKDGETSYLAFPLGDELQNRLLKVSQQVNSSAAISEYAEELTDLLTAITERSVYYYYHRPAEFIAINRIIKKAADVGIDAAVKGVQRIIRRVIKDIDHDDVVRLFDSLDQLLVELSPKFEVCSTEFAEFKA